MVYARNMEMRLSGALILFSATVHAQNLVTNGSFETGDFTGWTQGGNLGFTSVTSTNPPNPVQGIYQAQLGPVGSDGTLSQTLPTIPGAHYSIIFYLDNDGGPLTNFAAQFDGVTLLSLSNSPAQPYTKYSFTQTASAANTLLQFSFQQNPAYWFLDDIFVTPFIVLEDLSGNNRTLANYLNKNAPISVLNLFSPLQDSALSSALKSAAPTRNAFATYSSQTTYVALSQLISDHLRQNRLNQMSISGSTEGTQTASNAIRLGQLTVDASNEIRSGQHSSTTCKPLKPYTIWGSILGEYTHEKAQSQTPAFKAGVGGGVVEFEYNGVKANVVGGGAAYAHTHIHEESGAGHANVDQGFLNVYGTLTEEKWYFDLGLWGGYYHIDNLRKISLPGFHKNASSSTHGWQLAPHVEIGYDNFILNGCDVKWFGVEPFTMADWVSNFEDGFREHGGGILNMGQKWRYCSFVRSETGLRFHEIFEYGWGMLVLREKGSYAYQKAFDTGRINSFLRGSPGSFTVTALNGAQNLGIIELGMYFFPSSGKAPYVNISYQGEFGSAYQSHQGRLEIGKRF